MRNTLAASAGVLAAIVLADDASAGPTFDAVRARGAVICGAVSCELPVAEYTALQVKQSVVGYGKAAKEQVQHMVQRLLALDASPGPDAADALACAICHAHGGEGLGGQAGVGGRRRAGRILSL